MGDDVAALWDDACRYRDKYSPDALELLEGLVAGSRRAAGLTPEERRLLDLAVLDYSSPAPIKIAPKKPPAPKAEVSKEPEPIEQPRPGVDVPETELPAYWWLR